MSFSFRNIFSPEEGGHDGDPASLSSSGVTGFGQDWREMNPGGPPPGVEAGAQSQIFLASELLSFIPPAISAHSGIPMEKEIRVPLPQDGSRDVRLSILYQLCPELFAAEITPLNDSVFTLPPRLGETNSGLISGKAQTGIVSEFQGKSTPMKEEPRPRSDEPAMSPRGPEPVGNPFFSTSVPGGNSLSSPASGLAGFSGLAKSAEGVGGAAPEETEVELKFEGFSNGISARSPKPASPSPPGEIPSFETGGAAQEQKGEGEFSGNPFESAQGFKTLFSKHAEADTEIPPPAGFSPAETNDEPVGVWGSMFSGGGHAPVETGTTGGQSPFPASPFESIGSLVQLNETANHPGTNETPTVVGKPEIPDGAELQNPERPPSAPFSLPAGFASFDSGPPMTHTRQEEVKETQREAVEAIETPPHASPKAGLLGGSANPEIDPEGPKSELPAGAFADLGSEIPDLELRAIFSTSETFTLSKIARLVVDLPGIVSCTLSTPVKFVQASRSEQTRIGTEAREMVATLRNLAAITGLPDARTFTLHTDRGIVSLFLEGECCVTVHHEGVGFRPGVREKLILVARNLITVKE